ncbi:MAG: CBS domain-containing protein [Thermoprotei archaeon]
MPLVSKILKRPPITIDKSRTILESAKMLSQNSVGILVVVDQARPERPMAVVSERDIIRAVASGLPLTENVMKIASVKLVTVNVDDQLEKAALLMAANRIRHLVVLDEVGNLAGVISIRDILAERNMLTSMVKSYFS